MLRRVTLALLVFVALADDCCWCGKRYYQGEPTFPPERYVVPPMSYAIRPERTFFLEDEALAVRVHLNTNVLPLKLTFSHGDWHEEVVLEGEPLLVSGDASVFRVEFSGLHIDAGDSAVVAYTCDKTAVESTVKFYVAPAKDTLAAIGAVRVTYPKNGGSPYLERFSESQAANYWPYGYFVSWPLLADNTIKIEDLVGNSVHPVSPFSPGGLEAVATLLDSSAAGNKQWVYDMRHITSNTSAIREQVQRFAKHPAIFSWYIADEPDGAGSVEGIPEGQPRDIVQAAYRTVRDLDPYHPVSLVLNCQYSGPIYANSADIVFVDPYPVGINTTFCSTSYGCCGCDGCIGELEDVTRRVQGLQKSVLNSVPVQLVAQAFGNGEHWSATPSPAELRAMSYLGFLEDSLGMSYWLQSTNASSLLTESKALAAEFDHLHPHTVGEGITRIETGLSGMTSTQAWLRDSSMLVIAVNAESATDDIGAISIRAPQLSPAPCRVSASRLFSDVHDAVDVSVGDGHWRLPTLAFEAFETRAFNLTWETEC